jgi:hypothetical protein
MAGPHPALDGGVQLLASKTDTFRDRFEVVKDFALAHAKARQSCSRFEQRLITLTYTCRCQTSPLAVDGSPDVWSSMSVHHHVTRLMMWNRHYRDDDVRPRKPRWPKARIERGFRF